MKENLKTMPDSRLKATYLMYRDGDDTYPFYEIAEEYQRRDEKHLWGDIPWELRIMIKEKDNG